jgi:phosphatidylglycerophosphate synthase
MDYRDRRRTAVSPIGIVLGIAAGLLVFLAISLAFSRSFPVWWWISAAVVGALAGHVLAMLVNAEREDGEDDRGAYREHGGQVGPADAPLEGAQARDARRRAGTTR